MSPVPGTYSANETSTEGFTIVRIPGVRGTALAISPNGLVVGTGAMSEPELGQGTTAWIWRGSGTGDAERIVPNYTGAGGTF